MPSGSHGGGGGSHFGGGISGGSHFGGDSSGGGSHFGHHRVGSRTVIIWGGRNYYYSERTGSALSALRGVFVFAIIIALICTFGFMINVGNMHTIENDYIRYENMIETAENNSDYLKTATIKSIEENAGKWFYWYQIPKDAGGYLEGYTFSIYTKEEIKHFHAGQEILVAVDSKVVDDNTDSIPMDFKGTQLSRDGEYINSQNGKNGFSIAMVIGYVVAGGIFVSYIVTAVKNKQIEDTNPTPNVSTQSSSNSEVQSDSWKCPYCGNTNDKKKEKCSQCGAKREN